MKTIGILTSGGDAPGMNSAIRAAVRTALNNGMRIKGIRNGYDGLMKGDIYEMNVSSVADIIHKGGTILGTARSTEFKHAEGQKRGAQILRDYGIEGLIVIGGDGSYKGAKALSDLGIKAIGIPGTIDNDMGYTDFTIGFFTAIETVTDAIGKLRDTSSSHGRAVVIEVMGRNCGDLALFSGLAGGAESIIVPEHKFSIDEIVEKVNHGRKRGKLHHLIVLAEGVGNPYTVAKEVEERSGVETKVTVLGHVQRGGSPSATDRLLGSIMGAKAVELLKEEKQILH
ncbi:6-phosphofructokinase [Anaerococcus hydrogenalis DSM 7454]|uniref:6-phosphofructokinase n=1 Tax=Anaerococcus hydrogenalis DSM 7454 TaxID=561177 RepID=B6W6J0_9FIRM|nr:6-phosphofructokinase [Anaerococcus hydrogenalis DSM 7454]